MNRRIAERPGAETTLPGRSNGRTALAFRGRGYEHAIDIAGHSRLTGVFAPFRAERGETVGLRLDPAGCHVFPAAAAQPTAAGAADLVAKVPLSDVGPEFVPPGQRY